MSRYTGGDGYTGGETGSADRIPAAVTPLLPFRQSLPPETASETGRNGGHKANTGMGRGSI
jgi:hypothetical protein